MLIDNSEGFLCPRALQAEGGMLSWSMRAVFPLFRLDMIPCTLQLIISSFDTHVLVPYRGKSFEFILLCRLTPAEALHVHDDILERLASYPMG